MSARIDRLRKSLVCVCVALCVVQAASCNSHSLNSYQGYVEGEFIYIAAPEAGRLDSLKVTRGQTVSAQAPLFALEQDNESAGLRQAKQQLQAAQAQLADLKTGKRPAELDVIRAQLAQATESERLSATQFQRDEKQFADGSISHAQLDATRTTHQRDRARVDELSNQLKANELAAREQQIHAQEAQLKASQAALDQAQWRLDQKTVEAPAAGLVFDTLYVQGEWVAAGNPVISLLTPGNVKVRFFVPETRLGELKIGRAVTIACDGCGQPLPAAITYISTQPEFTPPVIFSNETRSKLVFMVEAHTRPQEALQLHPGQPVEVRL